MLLHRPWLIVGALAVAFCCGSASICLTAKGQTTTPVRDKAKFTEAPGKESENAKKLIDQAEATLKAGQSTTTILTDPSFLSVHEYPRFRKLIRQSAQTSSATIVSPKEPGKTLVVTGRIVDGDGKPVKQAIMYAYQTSDKGWYSDRAPHVAGNEGDRKHARLFGYLKTDAEGRFELHTIRPSGYPDSDLPAHIHVEIDRDEKGVGSLTTEIQFDDDPRLTAEWRKRSKQEGFVTGKVNKDSENRQKVEVDFKLR